MESKSSSKLFLSQSSNHHNLEEGFPCLLQKYLRGEATPQEKDQLLNTLLIDLNEFIRIARMHRELQQLERKLEQQERGWNA